MEAGILILACLAGVCVGLICGWVMTRRSPVGTLRIIYAEGEPQPYMCLDLDVPIQSFEANKHVLMKVKSEYYSSQE